MKLYIGVDGGATKTRFSVLNEEKKLLAECVLPGSNPNSCGKAVSKKLVHKGINMCLEKVGATADDVAGICLTMSGCDTPKDVAMFESWAKEILPNAFIRAFNDAAGGLSAGTEGHLYGIVVISGTGTIAMGFGGPVQPTARAAGWGSLYDGGSGYICGSRAIQAVFRAQDGTGAKTSLTEAMFKKLNISNTDQLLEWAHRKTDQPWGRIAELAQLPFREAEKGDQVSKKIVASVAKALGDSIKAVAKQLGFEDEKVPVVYVGSMFNEKWMREHVANDVRSIISNAQFIRTPTQPSLGAAMLAFNLCKQQKSQIRSKL
eukprot:TRINITY_DN7452_c0_g1_i1.p1 TRINITY_DN7452_c0_g1~~TRINITY_DN7452_c0_g1_i1.p1  ORF type:complete len:318 (-),score=78.54 TRINITY_DN7452_c0_g1_i1:208-1161(-)